MTAFETKTCTRCGGCGRYSFNQIDRDMCYGCGGSGKQYTKRGAAAREWLKQQRMVPAGEIALGQWVRHCSLMFKVEKIGLSGSKWLNKQTGEWVHYYDISGTNKRGESCAVGITSLETKVERIPATKQEAADLLAAALKYQETLTKAGTPRKRAEKEAG